PAAPTRRRLHRTGLTLSLANVFGASIGQVDDIAVMHCAGTPVIEIDRLGDKIEGTAVHRRAQISNVAIGIARTGECCSHSCANIVSPSITGILMSSNIRSMSGSAASIASASSPLWA